MRKLLITYLCLMAVVVSAQTYYGFSPLVSANYKGEAIAIDDVGNLLIVHGGHLSKLDAEGHFLARFFPPFQAKISCIDVDNPRRILLLYTKYNYLVALDQNLNMQAGTDPSISTFSTEPIDLQSMGRYDIGLACLDTYSGFWTYGKDLQDICLYDKDNDLSFCGDSPSNMQDMEANVMRMSENTLCINFPNKGVAIFDADGHFTKMLYLEGIKHFYVYNNILYYISGHTLVSVDIESEQMSYNILPVDNFTAWDMQLSTHPPRIAFLGKEGVEVYGMEPLVDSPAEDTGQQTVPGIKKDTVGSAPAAGHYDTNKIIHNKKI